MADLSFLFKFSKKEEYLFKKSVAGSLATRIFLTTTIFLVIPLIIFACLMYQYTYELKKDAQGNRLGAISDNQTLMFGELIDFALQRVEILSIYLKAASLDSDKKAIESTLNNIVNFTGVSGIFLIEKDRQTIKKIFSSSEFSPDISYEKLINQSSFAFNDFAITTDDETVGKEGFIYFSKVTKRDVEKLPIETLNLAISYKFFIEYLTRMTGDQGGYSISLFRNKDNVIFDSQEMAFLGKRVAVRDDGLRRKDEDLFFLKRIHPESSVFGFNEYNVKGFATILPLAQVNFNILITTSAFQESNYLEKFLYKTVYFLIFVILFGSFGAIFLTYLFSLPLKNISNVMNQISNNHLETRYEPISFGFEINKIGLLLNQMIDRLITNLKSIEVEKIKREKVEQELEIGHRIQNSLVPTEFPDLKGVEIKTLLLPAKQVGGDFYDCFICPSDPDKLIVLIADSAGHGIFGCFYSLTMRSILRTLGATTSDLRSIVKKANEVFYKDSKETQVFVTVWIGIYDLKLKELSYTSCGHPLGFLFRQGKLFKELKTKGIALGVVDELDPEIASVKLEKEDTLVFLTDGVTETMNNKQELFGKERVFTSVEKSLNQSLTQILNQLIADAEAFEENPENQDDDFTAVMMRIKD